MPESIFEYRPVPMSWLRSKWCARFHRRHVSMGYDRTEAYDVATATCQKCGRMVMMRSALSDTAARSSNPESRERAD